MKVLFVCNQNQGRSLTAENIFSYKFDVKSAGLHTFDLKKLLTGELVKWAEVIYVMEEEQEKEIVKRFPKESRGKIIINLDIPDGFPYMDEELIRILKEKVK